MFARFLIAKLRSMMFIHKIAFQVLDTNDGI